MIKRSESPEPATVTEEDPKQQAIEALRAVEEGVSGVDALKGMDAEALQDEEIQWRGIILGIRQEITEGIGYEDTALNEVFGRAYARFIEDNGYTQAQAFDVDYANWYMRVTNPDADFPALPDDEFERQLRLNVRGISYEARYAIDGLTDLFATSGQDELPPA